MKSTIAFAQYKLQQPDLEVVLAMVRGKNLAGAAERLGVDSSTVFRAIKRLERALGDRLFERAREGYLPSELAMTLAEHAERIESNLNEARSVVNKSSGAPSGVLRVTTTDTILDVLLLPTLRTFVERYPGIDFEFVATNSLANLSHREADVAIRATRKPPEHLVGVNLGKLRSGVFVRRDVLKKLELPGEVIDLATLAKLDWIAPDDSLSHHPSVTWRKNVLPKVAPRYRCNSVHSIAEAIRQGLGVGVAPLFMMDGDARMELLLGPLDALETELWILAHPDVRHLQRVKLYFDYLREVLTPSNL